MRFIAAILLLTLCTTDLTFAQQPNPFGAQAPLGAGAKRSPTPINAEKAVRVIYGSSSWNKDPSAIDSASVIIREGKTDKLVQVYLEETEPDSALFTGLYSVRWENVQKLAPEFYVAPDELLGKHSEIRELKNLITSKKIGKKPYIFRRVDKQQTVEIYDTTEQARLAYQAFAAEKAALALANRKIVPDSTVDAEQLAQSASRGQVSAKALQERIRLEQIEAQKRAARLKAWASLTPAERASRQTDAAKFAAQAMKDYRDGSYAGAEDGFSRALELNPTNTQIYFQYGVTLYKLNRYNPSIVYMTLAEDSPAIAVEKPYYLGLAYLRIDDHQNALTQFTIASKTKNEDIAPSAEFYRGMIFVDQKKFDEAMKSFQRVLDTSKDPKLDEKAEEMIERIQQLKQFEKEKAKRWSASALIGEMYDSNVLLISDTTQTGGATDLVGYRSLVAAGLMYRPTYTPTREFAMTFDVLHIYTVDSDFKQRAALRLADPSLVTLTAPYTIKSIVFDKGNKLDIKPGYEMLMSSQEDDAQKPILHSLFVTFDDVMVWSEKNLATAKFELRYDSSQLESSVGDSDASAFKTKLFVGNLKFLNPDRTKMLTSEFGFTLNQAAGKDVLYHRYDFSIGYIAPWLFDTIANAKFGYYHLAYPQQSGQRSDNDLGLTLSASKKINAVLTSGLTATYNRNLSNSTTYDYSKYSILATLAANWDF